MANPSMLMSYETLEAGLANLKEFGLEASIKAGREVLLPHSLGVPKVILTPGGLVATLEMGGIKTTCFITKPKGKSWGDTLRSFSESEAEFIIRVFQKDTMEALIAVWGADGAEAFYKGATPHPTGGYDEVFVRCMMCCLAGDILYWRTTSEMLLQSVDSECAEVDMLVRAKKAQVYYTHAKMDMEQVGERLGIHVVIE
jgi:hypothetical protein